MWRRHTGEASAAAAAAAGVGRQCGPTITLPRARLRPRRRFGPTRDVLLPLLDALVADEEFMVRQTLAQQLRGVAAVCVKDGGDEGYAAMLARVLPVLSRLVSDAQAEVRVAASETIIAVAGLVKKPDLGPHILTIVLSLAHDEEQEELRMAAVRRSSLRSVAATRSHTQSHAHTPAGGAPE